MPYFVMLVACYLQKFKKVYKIKVNFDSDEFKGYQKQNQQEN